VPTDKKPLRPASPSIDTQALSTSLISLSFFPFTSVLFLATAVHYACFACFVLFRHAILLLFYLLARGRASQIQARQKVRCTGATFYRFLIISLSQRAWATKSQSKALSPSFLAHAILRSAQEAEVEQEAGKV